ncbi:MAG: DUF1828 domain-containing protein [Armatimonadetes bacterium]|nr:DUF1828 domain-containing protein [Armatimonadota bacterium]
MTAHQIEAEFRKKVSTEVRLVPEGRERYRVFAPFVFDDGDAFCIALRRESEGWVLTDEGHTYMHLSYEIDGGDLHRGTRQRIIGNALSAFGVRDRTGELVMPVENDDYGDALFSFIQALARISDVSYLTREQARSTFMEDLQAFLRSAVPEERLSFGWHDPSWDAVGKYTVDCRANGAATPLFIYGLPSDDRVRDAHIALLQFQTWGLAFRSLAVFENQEEINRKVLARFTDVVDRQFASLANNGDRIAAFVQEALDL